MMLGACASDSTNNFVLFMFVMSGTIRSIASLGVLMTLIMKKKRIA